jgi:arylsulfatase
MTFAAVLAAAVFLTYSARIKRSVTILSTMARPIDGRERLGVNDDGPNILLVTLDTCRADKFGIYGFDRDTTPAMDNLARDPDSAIFLNHYVQATWSKPSTASLLTGLHLSEHGVALPFNEDIDENSEPRQSQALSPDLLTLAEGASEAGLYTFGVINNHHIGAEVGFAQGFDEYFGTLGTGDYLPLRTATALIDDVSGRFFGYVHFLGCHAPFPSDDRDSDYMGQYGSDYDEKSRKQSGVDFSIAKFGKRVEANEIELTTDDIEYLHLVYEAKLRMIDRTIVAPLIEFLKETDRYDDTLIVITADHGEAIYEQGDYGHGTGKLWEEVTRVPMIVKYPQGEKPASIGGRVSEITRSIDIFPSVLAMLGVPAPPGIRGVPALQGVFAPYALTEDIHSCTSEQDISTCQSSVSLVKDGFQLITSDAGNT